MRIDRGVSYSLCRWRPSRVVLCCARRYFATKVICGTICSCPVIAIATLLIAFLKEGTAYAAVETRSMIIGSSALLVYSLISCQLMKRFKLSGLLSTFLASGAWFGCAFGLNWKLTGMF